MHIRKPQQKEESEDEIVLVRTVVKYVLGSSNWIELLTVGCSSDKRPRQMIVMTL